MKQTTFRAINLFSGIISAGIAVGKKTINADAAPTAVRDSVYDSVIGNLSVESTLNIATAAAKIIPNAELSSLPGAKTVLDFNIKALGAILTNDVLDFINVDSEFFVAEARLIDGEFTVNKDKKRASVSKQEYDAIPDALRDELSGENIYLEASDNHDCGDACKI